MSTTDQPDNLGGDQPAGEHPDEPEVETQPAPADEVDSEGGAAG
jgi:hypothetical protein